jgi:hypothetical protein
MRLIGLECGDDRPQVDDPVFVEGDAIGRLVGDREDAHVLCGIAIGQAVQGRHFLATRRTPRRPEIHDDDVAAIVADFESALPVLGMERQRSDAMPDDRADAALGIEKAAGESGHRKRSDKKRRRNHAPQNASRPTANEQHHRHRAGQNDRRRQNDGIVEEKTRNPIRHSPQYGVRVGEFHSRRRTTAP